MLRLACAALFVVSLVVLPASPSMAQQGGKASAGAGPSCKTFLSQCTNRCKTRYANDPDCVSDHCTPKYNSCLQSGCWQEGGDFGRKLTCDLTKR